ncbi:MAG TPA: hypothetical protein VFO10_22695 [Oligoflexus sp.]|uniref:hypothetical protein n=1 Tax=Oligoflexus sp. TaxID=1971216 RepID=UPI002D7F6100|nr:hypothetical protein [Oligoflexus sp.]HET9240089.1 hypothetical protein [Oligoflexus sp.]
MILRQILATTILILQSQLFVTACGFLCESEHCNDWQTAKIKTCRTTVALPNVDFPIRVHLRVVSPHEILYAPQEEWDPALNEQRPKNDGSLYDQLHDFGISCDSNLFTEILVENYPAEKLPDSICSLSFQDDQATRFDLSWTSKTQSGKAVIQTLSAAPETLLVPRGTPDTNYISLATQNFTFPERTLHFPNLPVEVLYTQTIEDGYDATHPNDTGVRYRYSCVANNLHPKRPYVLPTGKWGRDEAILQEICSFSSYEGFSDQRVEITPEADGITVRVLDSQDNVLDESFSTACEHNEKGRKR